MAKTVDLRTYIALEKAFQRRLLRSWRIQSAPTYAAITHACLDHKWDEARRLVTDLDMAEVGTENREWITYMLLSLGVFGANMVAKGKPSFVGVGSFDTFLKQTTNNILQYLEFNATAQIQAEALQSIAEDEAKTKAASLKVAFDPAQPRDKEGQWTRSARIVSRLLDRAKGLNKHEHEDYQPVTITDEPRKTKLLLPDGTRLASQVREHSDVVFEALTQEGQGFPPNLGAVMAAGVVRYSAGQYGGVEIKAPLTIQQARIIADDWNIEYKAQVIRIDMSPQGENDFDSYQSGQLQTPVEPSQLKNWSERAFHKLNTKAAWDERKHPRDKEGQFARSGTLRQPGEEPDDMEGGGPERKKWSDLNAAVMAADDEFFAAKEAHLPHANRAWDRFVEETKPFNPDDTANIAAVEERVFSDPEYLKTKAALKAAEMKQLDADAALKAQTPLMKIEVVTNLANSEAEKMGVSPWHINVVDKDPPSFMVGDKQFTEAGHYQPSNEQIEINVRDLSYGDASIVRGIVSHELSHFVWHTMKSVADREFQRYLAKAVTPDGQNHTAWYHERFGGVAGDVVIHSYRKLKPEYYEEMAKEFPASMALSGLSGGPANIFSGISAEMVKENGHSAYAKSYWTPEAVKSRNGSYDTAINETIAEVTRYLRHPKSWAYEEHTPSLDSPWVKMTSGMYTWHRARQARIKELVS